MEEGRIVSKRRKEIVAWTVTNFKRWPTPYETPGADPSEIGCELVFVPGRSSLPIMRCLLGGAYVDSTDWFYAKRNKKYAT